jgi:hypothetical protein
MGGGVGGGRGDCGWCRRGIEVAGPAELANASGDSRPVSGAETAGAVGLAEEEVVAGVAGLPSGRGLSGQHWKERRHGAAGPARGVGHVGDAEVAGG